MNYQYIRTSTPPYYIKAIEKQAMGAPRWKSRTGYKIWDVDSIEGDPSFQQTLSELQAEDNKQMANALLQGKELAQQERDRRRSYIAAHYGADMASPSSGLYHAWLMFKGNEGIYIFSLSPYCSKFFEGGVHKFSIFKKKLNVASAEAINDKIALLQKAYAEKFGIVLDPIDFEVPKEGDFSGSLSVKLDDSGEQKVVQSPRFQELCQIYGIDTSKPGWKSQLKRVYDDFRNPDSNVRKAYDQEVQKMLATTHKDLDAAYKAKVMSGEAFLEDMPPPPSPSWPKAAMGQQQFTTIYKERSKAKMEKEIQELKKGYLAQDMSDEQATAAAQDEINNRYGFDSIAEAVAFLKAEQFKDIPFPESYPNITSQQLEEAFNANQAKIKEKGGAPDSNKLEKPKKTPAKAPDLETTRSDKPAAPENKPPASLPQPQQMELQPINDNPLDGLDDKTASKLIALIKLAETMDKSGQYKKAEEIHKVLRKYLGKKS